MSFADLVKLVFLSAIWGASFIFLRISVPEFGPLLTATLRTLLAALALLLFARACAIDMRWRANAKIYALVGLCAVVLPFCGFSFAAQYVPAAHMAVLNSTAPLFGALLSTFLLEEALTLRKVSGLLLGIAGVALLVGAGSVALTPTTLLASGACLVAACAYASASILVKKSAQPGGVHPIAMATASLVFGAAVLLPTLPFSLPAAVPSLPAFIGIAAVALLSSGLAQVIFIPLIVKIGPTRAMSVSFLIPLFSMLWGLLLGEAVHASTLIGAGIVLLAMRQVLTTPKVRVLEKKA